MPEGSYGALVSDARDHPIKQLHCKIRSANVGAEGLRKPLYPFLNWADARIAEWRQNHPGEWELLRPALLRQVSNQLAGLTYRTFILEANILSLRCSSHAGSTERSIIDQFAETATDHRRYVQRLFLSYPALTRLSATSLFQWWKNTSDLLTRLHRDARRIEACILRQPIGALQSINATLSDPHHGGKRVTILHLSGGQKLVYKPRPVEVDEGYQHFIEWLNNTGIAPQLRMLGAVKGEDYGWIEFVEVEPLDTPGLDKYCVTRLGRPSPSLALS